MHAVWSTTRPTRQQKSTLEMNATFELWLFGVALASSMIGGMLGMGSGLFVVPVLTMFGHVDVRTAIGASIISVVACSCAGAAPYLDGRLTNVRLAIVLEIATTSGALAGVFLADRIATRWLLVIFALVLLMSAYQMTTRRKLNAPAGRGPRQGSALEDRLRAVYPDRDLGRDVTYDVENLPLGMTLMFGAGLISALLGIGGGVLKIPAMDGALRLPLKVSSATSNFMIGVTATASAGAYFMQGSIVPVVAGPVVIGSVLGGIAGARVLMVVSSERIRVLFVVVLVGLAGQMMLNAFGVGRVGGGG